MATFKGREWHPDNPHIFGAVFHSLATDLARWDGEFERAAKSKSLSEYHLKRAEVWEETNKISKVMDKNDSPR